MAQETSKMPFGKQNYRIMLVGLAVLFLGFTIMSLDSTTFGFGFLGLTLGPVVVFIGFMIPFVALLNKPKRN
ncbi:MAG: DUF3098 domain-containing protein [Bacteroidetes bacterium]|nr:MAG: DUF3098 domain-containing protein [Bacteroidota bacterium]